MDINDFFKEIEGMAEAEPLKMSTTEFIDKARTFIAAVANLYWSNWENHPLDDDECYENKCDICQGNCTIKRGEDEWEVTADRESGLCFARVFNRSNYAVEMGELIEQMNYLELLDTTVILTDPTIPISEKPLCAGAFLLLPVVRLSW